MGSNSDNVFLIDEVTREDPETDFTVCLRNAFARNEQNRKPAQCTQGFIFCIFHILELYRPIRQFQNMLSLKMSAHSCAS